LTRLTAAELAERVTALLASQDGFTLTNDGRPLERGYVVGGLIRLEGDALAKLPQPHSAAEYEALERRTAEILERHRAAIETGAAIGGWRQGDTITLDLVTTHSSGRQAARAARDRQQVAFGYLDNYRYASEVTL
jgi:hypothetical protein